MGMCKAFLVKLGPVIVIVLAVMAFANSTVSATREAGYVPVIISTTTGTTSGVVRHHRVHPKRKKKSHAVAGLEVRTTVDTLPVAGTTSTTGSPPPPPPPSAIPGDTDDGQIFHLPVNILFPFQVRWRTFDDCQNPAVALSVPKVVFTARLFDPLGNEVKGVDISKLVDLDDSPYKHDPQHEEMGTVALLDDGNYAHKPGYHIRLHAMLRHNEKQGEPHHDDEYSYNHHSVRLYWQW